MISEQQLSEWEEWHTALPESWSSSIPKQAITALIAHVREQQKRIAELEADAARYRWLRDQQHNNTQLIKTGKPFIAIRVYDGYHFAASDPDAAIDAVRAQETSDERE